MPGTLGGMAEVTAQRQHLRFCLALHRVLASAGGNTCFSPYSVASALGLAYQAARGPTADELRALLSGDEPDIAKQLELLADAATLDVSRDGEEPVLAVSNTLWAWDRLPVNEDFGADLAGWPGAKVAYAPFVTDPEAARQAINDDVARTTRDLITELVPEGAVTIDTVASLVNALYLKAVWRNPFAAAHTADETFHAPGGDRTVPMMRQTERLGYAEADGWQAAVLPAAGGVQAVVLLPEADLAEATLDVDVLAGLLDGVRTRRVSLGLPRVDVGMNVSLTTALGELGVRELFTPDADLRGLSPDPRLFVSDALHESVLTLDEDGLEGAAATAMMIRMTSVAVEEPVSFVADRPFLLLIRHAATGAIYFLARVTDPA